MVSYPSDHHFSQCTSILHFRRIALPLRMQSSFNWGEAAPLGPFCLELLSPITVLGLEQQKHFLVTYKIRRYKKFLGKRKDVIHKTKMPGTNPLNWSKYIFMSRGNRGLGHNSINSCKMTTMGSTPTASTALKVPSVRARLRLPPLLRLLIQLWCIARWLQYSVSA